MGNKTVCTNGETSHASCSPNHRHADTDHSALSKWCTAGNETRILAEIAIMALESLIAIEVVGGSNIVVHKGRRSGENGCKQNRGQTINSETYDHVHANFSFYCGTIRACSWRGLISLQLQPIGAHPLRVYTKYPRPKGTMPKHTTPNYS